MINLTLFQFEISFKVNGPNGTKPICVQSVFIASPNIGLATRCLFSLYPDISSYTIVSENSFVIAD